MKVIYVILICSIFVLSGCSDVEVSNYKNYRELIESGAVARGWAPDFMPATAYEISEGHSVEISEIMISFSFGSDFLPAKDSRFTALNADERRGIEKFDFPRWARMKKGEDLDIFSTCSESESGILFVDNKVARALYMQPAGNSKCN